MGPSFCTGKQTPEHGMETSGLTSEEKIQESTFCGKSDAHNFLGLTRVNTGTLSGRGTTVNNVRYSEMLSTELKPAIRTKRRGLLSSGVLLLHENARPHTAIHTLQTLVKLGFTVVEHPAYSPDLAPFDYHLFGPLKDALRGRRFPSDEGVKEAVHEWLAAQPKTFFSEGIQKLLERWNKRIAKHGDYVQK